MQRQWVCMLSCLDHSPWHFANVSWPSSACSERAKQEKRNLNAPDGASETDIQTLRLKMQYPQALLPGGGVGRLRGVSGVRRNCSSGRASRFEGLFFDQSCVAKWRSSATFCLIKSNHCCSFCHNWSIVHCRRWCSIWSQWSSQTSRSFII